MQLRDIMSTAVETVQPMTPVSQARARMRSRGIRHLVVQSGHTIVGVVSDRDLGGRLGVSEGTVGERMETDVISAVPETTVRQAANLMRGRRIGSLPVVEGGQVVGIITVTDLLELIGRGVERPVAQTKRRPLTRPSGRRAHTIGHA